MRVLLQVTYSEKDWCGWLPWASFLRNKFWEGSTNWSFKLGLWKVFCELSVSWFAPPATDEQLRRHAEELKAAEKESGNERA